MDDEIQRFPGGDDEPAIEELLDIGYEQLDGFVTWLEGARRVSTRFAQQDCFNAEMLIDYLANSQHKSATDINEFEARWFLYSHYIRKAQAEAETEERLPTSLRSFYTYLSEREGYELPLWLTDLLDDPAHYLNRRHQYVRLNSEDEQRWQEGFVLWCSELDEEMDMRGLLLPGELSQGLEWGEKRGWREATLWEEANRNWQEQRTMLLEEGLPADELQQRLRGDYDVWLDTPQERLEGSTPFEMILTERQELAEREGEQDSDDTEE